MTPKCKSGGDSEREKRENHEFLISEILYSTSAALMCQACGCPMCKRSKYVAAIRGLLLTFLDASLDRPDVVTPAVFKDMMRAVSQVAHRFTADNPNSSLPPFPPVCSVPDEEPPPPSDLSLALARRVVAHDDMLRSDPEYARTPVVRRAMYDDMVSKARALLSNAKVPS